MATAASVKEIQEYLDLAARIDAIDTFCKMFSELDLDGNVGKSTSKINVTVEYNDGTSAKLHTNADFNMYFGQFIDANIVEIAGRVGLFSHETLEKERQDAMNEVGDLGLYPTPNPFIPPQNCEAIEGTPVAYTTKGAHLALPGKPPVTFSLDTDTPLPAGLVFDTATGAFTGEFAAGAVAASPYSVTVIAKNSDGGIGSGPVTFIVAAA